MCALQTGISPLFEACQPRSDVIDGTLEEEQFAANLATVAHEPGEAAPVYRDATEFFDTTYPTEGLTTLLSNLSGRFLAAADRDTHDYKSSILCLDTTFGGGKTHDLIASYHLANSPTEIDKLSKFVDKDELASDYLDAVSEGLEANSAVFVGGTSMLGALGVVGLIRTHRTRTPCGVKSRINCSGSTAIVRLRTTTGNGKHLVRTR
jgi:hypothetical protein